MNGVCPGYRFRLRGATLRRGRGILKDAFGGGPPQRGCRKTLSASGGLQAGGDFPLLNLPSAEPL
jgi:hypothetical protein